MPLFVIHALDAPGKLQTRLDAYADHRAYLAAADAQGVTIAASGPLVSDDGATPVGSLLLVEASSIEVARRFNAGDPFAKAGLWANVSVQRFDLRRGSVGAPA
jgi:uncharacterized protein YciI